MFEAEMEKLIGQKLQRQFIDRASAQGPVIAIGGKKLVNFSSNDYLGFAAHPDLVKAAAQAMLKYGFGAGASRLLAGGTVLHAKLEKTLSAWKRTESAVVFNSGYAANTGIIPAIADEGDLIFSDSLNHASIIEGCRLSRAKTIIYRHGDIRHLQTLMKKCKTSGKKIVVTDTVFSMDGDLAPLKDLYDFCKSVNASRITHNALLLYLDDAHGTGVLGNGSGALAHFGLKPEPWIIQMGTFSKALGAFGAFAAGSEDTMQWISNRARSLIFSTALPPAVIAAVTAAVQLIRKDRGFVQRLWTNREYLINALQAIGYDEIVSETPIIPIRTSTIEAALRLSQFLFDHGVYAPAIRPPTVAEPRIRVVVTAAHEKKHLERLVLLLKKVKKDTPGGRLSAGD
ncbi:MAG: 8-amino-7-oxononanoate synthase [Nitrospirae bacterium]|nr:8-amino-7-oxononanoate synthase [Nitrospirota bacterium]